MLSKQNAGKMLRLKVTNGFDTTQVPLRFHMLKASDQSMRHAYISIAAQLDEESRELAVGSATHAMVFNTDRVIAAPMRRDDRSDKWKRFEAENIGAMIVTPSEYEEAAKISDAVRAHKFARELIDAKGALVEKTVHFEWPTDDYLGRKCRATPDVVLPGAFIADLKTSKDASPAKWPYLMRDYDIAGQLAWYATPYPAEKHYTIVVEKGTNIVQVYPIGDASMAAAWHRNVERLKLIRKSEETGAWQAYSREDELIPIEQAAAWPKAESPSQPLQS